MSKKQDTAAKEKKLSPREAIWEWYRSVKLPRGRAPRSQSARYKDSCTYRCVLHMDGEERLVIGIWKGRAAEPVGVYYMTRSALYYATRDGASWYAGKYSGMTHDGYGCYYSDVFAIESVEDACRPWAVAVGKDAAGYDYERTGYDVLDIVERIESSASYLRKKRAIQRKLDSITNWANGMPDLPTGFDAWLRAVPFGGAHFQFFDKKAQAFGCSACGALHAEGSPEAKTWRRGQTVVCPTCGAVCKIIRHGSTDHQRKTERVMLVQSHRDRKGRICSVARHLQIEMEWRTGEEHYTVYPSVLVVLPLDGTPATGNDVYYRAWNEWSDKNPCQERSGKGYCYPDLSALAGTAYTGMGLESAAAKGWKMKWNSLMRDCRGDPRVEYLIKGNFKRLVADLAEGYSAQRQLHSVRGDSVTAADILGLDGQGVARLRQHDGGAAHLKWIQAQYGCLNSWKLPDATWDWLAENKIAPMELSRMMDRTVGDLSLEQAVNYLKKQLPIYREARRKGANLQGGYGMRDIEAVRVMWRDTLEMGMTLKLDFSKSMNVRPPSLVARHDELLEIINAERDKLDAARAEERFPEVAPTCDRIRATYEWGDGKHKVLVPTGVYDIQREGRLLHHCVAANERYLDRIAEGESYILFLRRESAPDTPWYTMEVEPGGRIRQLRTTGDDDGAGVDRDEAKGFLREWARVIRARCSEAELHAAEVAREKRLRNFDELRAGGNIIRNGRLQGRLLVDVLERDFRELNEDVG